MLLGLDVGGTKCAALVGTARGEVLGRVEWPSHAQRGPELMIADFVHHARQLLERHPGVSGTGVAIGGPMDPVRGIIHGPPHLPDWEGVHLKERLQEMLQLPVAVEHDAMACALAEYYWGAGKGCHALVYLTCGTGFGAGFIFEGKPLRGAAGHSSEIGHVRFREDGPVAFGKKGSAEAYCSGTAISLLAAWKYPQRWGQSPRAHAASPREIARLAAEGDGQAADILAINAAAVGEVCANLADMLCPDRIVLGSLARHLGEPWLKQVQLRFSEEALESAQKACQVVPAGLGERLQDCSALAAAMEA